MLFLTVKKQNPIRQFLAHTVRRRICFLPMNLTPKAALKTPALQTRPLAPWDKRRGVWAARRAGYPTGRVPDALLRREAFGVRASLAPLFRRRSPKVRFHGAENSPKPFRALNPRTGKAENPKIWGGQRGFVRPFLIFVRPKSLSRFMVRVRVRIPRSPDSRLEPLNRKGEKPKDLGRTKMFFPSFPHLSPSQIFGWVHGEGESFPVSLQ